MTERKTIYLDDALEAIRRLPNVGIYWFVSAEAVFNALLKLPSAYPEPCEDTVSRKDCLKALSNLMDIDGFRDGWAVSRANVECMLKSMPSVTPKKQRWIPCSERLPEIKQCHVSDPCIVYCENGAYGFAELEENIFGQVGWNCERDDEYHEPLGEVIAWMPLPEPYKAESEEV